MSNDLATVGNSAVALNKAFGYQGRPKPIIPFLKVNGSDEEVGKTAPKGTFVYDDGENVLHTTACTIRSFTKVYQYRLFDGKKPDSNDMSIIFNNFQQELRSTSGRIACGRLTKRVAEEMAGTMSAQQKYFQDMVKCKLIIFGLVSGEFTNVETKKKEHLKDALFMWVVSQSGYINMDKAITGIEKERRPVPLTEIKLTLKKDQNGAVTYYSPVPEVTTTVAALDVKRDTEYLERIKKFITDTNTVVNERFNAANKSKQSNENFAGVSKAVLNDEIPF